ncbi:hypothetical protein B0H13DRAFT_1916576 [Mycena leptocephala]|nr:hypothetical protein B0H13DRAFT_1916576 [Mycena leptocephala]
MDDETHVDAESASGPTTDSPGSSSHGSAIFSGSHHFTVAGGTFKNFNNVTNNYTSTSIVPSDFRMIPIGDIDLLEEICLNNETGVVGRHHPETRVQRMYSAKIDGGKSGVTVAVYQGNGAEEEWRQDIANYMTVRHPNIIQMRGASIDFTTASNYFDSVFQRDVQVPSRTGLFSSHFLKVIQIPDTHLLGYHSEENMDARQFFLLGIRDYNDVWSEPAPSFWPP